MKRLREMQSEMARAIQSPTSLVTPPPDPSSFAEREVRPSARVGSGSAHLDIYREQFGLRHRASLTEDFPALRAHVGRAGEAAWDALLTDYLAAYPPSHVSLLYAGHALGDFLGRDTSPFPTYFEADLANFEYALVAMSELADAPPLAMEAVSAVPEDAWPAVRLVFQPALSLMSFAFPVHRARMAIDQGGSLDVGTLSERQTWLALARDAKGTPTYVEMDRSAFFLLRELTEGAPLGAASAIAATKLGVEMSALEADLPGWFQNWIAWGWVSSLVIAQEQR